MSNFLKELTSSIENCCREDYDYDWADNTDELSMVMDLIGSLGENARRMLEMGIVQDKLVELGFRINRNDYPYESWKDEYFVHFLHEAVVTGVKINIDHPFPDWESFNYTSPTWQDDLIAKVEDLIKSAQPLD